MYAALFKVVGFDLVNIRWLLFLAACVTEVLVYTILRRFLAPIASATLTLLALVWSFPNYFAGLPSWWLLVCALSALLALMRYIETGGMRYLAVAGTAAGLAVILKQTGIYLIPPVLMTAWLTSTRSESVGALLRDRIGRLFLGLAFLSAAVFIMRSRLFVPEIVYLLLPVAASSIAFALPARISAAPRFSSQRLALLVPTVAAAIPVLLFLIPYIIGNYMQEFFIGAFVLPQKRLAFAAETIPGVHKILYAVLIVGLLIERKPGTLKVNLAHNRLRWAGALLLLLASLFVRQAYQIVWQSARGIGALLPLIALWLLATDRAGDERARLKLFAASSMLAWASLVQFPYAAPIYFCYVAPLVVIAAVAVTRSELGVRLGNPQAYVALLIGFAVLSMNRTYPDRGLGSSHRVAVLNTALDLPRAHLRVSEADANIYRRIVALAVEHGSQATLLAGPDCPEIYFLTGHVNPTHTIFDFFARHDAAERATWRNATIVVINHEPAFSPPLPAELVDELRQHLRNGEVVGRFEVRW